MSERTAYRREYIWENDIFEKLNAYALIDALKAAPTAGAAGLLDSPDLDGLAVAIISGTFQILPCTWECWYDF